MPPRTPLRRDDLGVEDRITRDMFRVVGELAIEQDDQRLDVLQVVDQMGGPQTLLPSSRQFQRADTPERLDDFVARLRAYPAYMAANVELLREGVASGLTAPRIVAERTIAQLERMLAMPIEEAVVPSMAKVAEETIASAIRDDRPRRGLPGRRGVPRGAPGRVPRRKPARSRASGRRPTATRSTATAIRPGRRSSSTRARSTRSASTSSSTIEAERRAIARAGLRRRHDALPGPLDGRCLEHAADREEELHRPGERGHRAGDGARAAVVRARSRAPAAEVRAVEEYKERDAPFAYYYPPSADGSRPGDLLRQHLRPAVADVLASSPRRRTTRRCPGHHFQIALEMENTDLNTFRRLGSRIVGGRLRRGLGPVRASASPTRWASTATRPSASGCSTRRRGARRGSSSTRPPRAALDAPAVDRLLLGAGLSRDRRGDRDRPLHRWPGQALTYKIGQREIERLRARARRPATAPAFDLRAFHDQVLGHGSLPLATLDARAAELGGRPRSERFAPSVGPGGWAVPARPDRRSCRTVCEGSRHRLGITPE